MEEKEKANSYLAGLTLAIIWVVAGAAYFVKGAPFSDMSPALGAAIAIILMIAVVGALVWCNSRKAV